MSTTTFRQETSERPAQSSGPASPEPASAVLAVSAAPATTAVITTLPEPRRRPGSASQPALPVRPVPVSATVYWRRRFFALLVGLAILALVAWALAGALGGSSPAASPAATKSVSSAPPNAVASAASSAPAGSNAASTQQTSGSPSRKAASSGHYGMRPCGPGSVVLSLFSSQASYSLRQTPQFEVDVVSTQNRSCTFDIGAQHVLLRISAGSQLVWTSANCAEGQASLVTRLRRGVPTVVPIAWDGQHSSPGCPVPGAAAPAGTYSATASDSAGPSNSVAFRIG
jgi:hypothetical protein